MSYVSTTFLWPILDLSVLPVGGALEQLGFLFMHFILFFFFFYTILYSPACQIWCVLSMFKGAKWGLRTHEENCHNTNNREHYKYNWVFRLLPGSAPNYRHNSSELGLSDASEACIYCQDLGVWLGSIKGDISSSRLIKPQGKTNLLNWLCHLHCVLLCSSLLPIMLCH